MQVKMVWIRMSLKFVLKYDRNSVVNISKKQRVAAPWVIINLLSQVSYIFRTRESLIMLICELHSALRLKSHFTRKKHSTETNKTEWSWSYSFRVTHEHEENDTSFKLMRQSPRIFFFLRWMNWLDRKLTKQWIDCGEGLGRGGGGHMINKFYRSFSSS